MEIKIKDISFRYDLNSSAGLLPIVAFQSFNHVFCSARSCDYFAFWLFVISEDVAFEWFSCTYIWLHLPPWSVLLNFSFIVGSFFLSKHAWYDNVTFSEFKVFLVVLKELIITEFWGVELVIPAWKTACHKDDISCG